MKLSKYESGFTLIELLVVISIIGVLSTIAMTSLNGARLKAQEAKKISDFDAINKALLVFYSMNNRMPYNYNPCCGVCEGDGYYERSMGELVSAGLLASVPKSPDSSKYCYYDYGANNNVGAIIVTGLLNSPYSTTGRSGSCRPFADDNWCSSIHSSQYYCKCATY